MRLAIFVTHPIQYFAPLWRGLAASGMDLKVFFFSDHSVSGRLDSGFGVNVKWDVPVLEGYQSEFISRGADLERPSSVAIPDPDGLLDKEKPEVVMIHGYRNRFEQQLTKICRKRGIPTVLRGEFSDAPTYHGRSRLKGLLRSIFLKRYYRRITSFCFIGQIARQHLLSYGVAEKQLFFSPYSVDTDLFEKQIALLDRSRCREELKIKQDETVLLFSGKLIPRKAPLLILDALNRLSDEQRSRVQLLLVGEGELRSQLEHRGRALLGDRCRVTGFVNQSELGRYYAASDVLVFPSRHETWGLAVNEAMQFGMPVIVGDRVQCHVDLVTPQTGRVCADNDAGELALHIADALNDPQGWRDMGQAARRHIAAYSTQASVNGVKSAIEYAAKSCHNDGRKE